MTLKEFLADCRQGANPSEVAKLCAIIEMQDAELRAAEQKLDGIKYSLESRVYTLDEDEFCKVFEVRDDIQIAQAQIELLLNSAALLKERG